MPKVPKPVSDTMPAQVQECPKDEESADEENKSLAVPNSATDPDVACEEEEDDDIVDLTIEEDDMVDLTVDGPAEPKTEMVPVAQCDEAGNLIDNEGDAFQLSTNDKSENPAIPTVVPTEPEKNNMGKERVANDQPQTDQGEPPKGPPTPTNQAHDSAEEGCTIGGLDHGKDSTWRRVAEEDSMGSPGKEKSDPSSSSATDLLASSLPSQGMHALGLASVGNGRPETDKDWLEAYEACDTWGKIIKLIQRLDTTGEFLPKGFVWRKGRLYKENLLCIPTSCIK